MKLTKRVKKAKYVLRRQCPERFDDIEVRATYQNAFQAEVLGFSEREGG